MNEGTPPVEWELFHPNPDLPPADTELRDGEFLVRFYIQPNSDNETIDDLSARYCRVEPDIEGTVEECRKAEINGRAWSWTLIHEETFGGLNDFIVATISRDRVYAAVAHVPDGAQGDAGLREVRQLLGSFIIHES